MLLKNLISFIPEEKKKIKITGLSINSKDVKKGNIFFAIKGNNSNGEKFIEEAINKGASVIISSKNFKYKNNKILIIKKKNIRNLVSELSSKFYKLKPKNIIAVTGTNGKTSVADLFYQILSLNNIPAASIGTLGVKYKNKVLKTGLTSPDTISIHKYLEILKKKKIDNVIIEASSHGLDQCRLNHINFKAGIFTNFSQDHLDYHKNMKSYLNAKFVLFKKILKKNSTIISDKNIKEFSALKKIAKKRELKVSEISKIIKIIKKFLLNNESKYKLNNLAMAIAATKFCNLKDKKIIQSLKGIKDVDGRLELVREFKNNIKVFIDYAHTPDALSTVLESLNHNYGKNVSLVFGCGGDRDNTKRSLMAKVANRFSKKIYVTDDNPRNEDPKKIRNEIIKNINSNKCFNIGKREEAIKKAIINSEPDTVVLIAGKGHEDKQIYKNNIINISDKQIVKNLNLKIKTLSKKKKNYLENKSIFKKIKKNINIGNFDGLALDSRIIKRGNLFLTIKGKKNDGGKFALNALKNGAKYIVSSKIIKKYKKKTISVKNEIKFLNQFAKLKRDNSKAKIIAITGSAGKTSLKNLIKQLLQNFAATYSSPKSFNNHFGVPASLSNLNASDKYGVFEVGMSKPGEIKNLSKLIRPHIGIITNIGEAHIENFNNIQGIAKAKAEIIDAINANGSIILNYDDKFFSYLCKRARLKKLKIISFGKNKKSDIHPLRIIQSKNSINLFLKVVNEKIKLNVKNINIYNILAALAVLKELNLNLNNVKKIFKNFEPTEGRGKIHLVLRYNKKFKLIDESYNANPLSVKNAITSFDAIKKKKSKKYLILGDMLELGRWSEKYHKDLSKVINNSNIDKVFIRGEKTLFTYKNLLRSKQGNILQNKSDIDLILGKIIKNNDYLMIKGSNATGLNALSKKIIRGLNVI
ncbi:UDP-N-acetylmuramoyl-L-alanyl-D-glutamate--2,6-diaminopimelate ligase [Pelagibacteraceae bacterium]|nr:UDP-N-acetylmuramoyl-L-alanyl-D-glutamate--2,6-diaminopimelate ligase [Pelagibacteraceae bacterium]